MSGGRLLHRPRAIGLLLTCATAWAVAASTAIAGPPSADLIPPENYDRPAAKKTPRFSTTSFDGSDREVGLGEYPGRPVSAKVEFPLPPRPAPARPAPLASPSREMDNSRERASISESSLAGFDAALEEDHSAPLPAPLTPAFPDSAPPAPGGEPSGDGPNLSSGPAQAEDAGPPFDDQAHAAIVGRPEGAWTKQYLPSGFLYRTYLAGEKESRFALQTLNEQGRGMIWEVALGGRAGIFRKGTKGVFDAEGWQIDIEGASFVRLDLMESQDVDAVDFRFGIPITHRRGKVAQKFGYYHISSHTGDEYLVKHPGYQRINYVRETFFYGLSYDVDEDWRVYGELGYAWSVAGGAKPFELQFGAEYSPRHPFAERGHAPFAAVNFHLREEFGMGGSVNALAGWQWRGAQNNHLFRIGAQVYNGKSMQWSFYDRSETLVGMGFWFDY